LPLKSTIRAVSREIFRALRCILRKQAEIFLVLERLRVASAYALTLAQKVLGCRPEHLVQLGFVILGLLQLDGDFLASS